MANKRIFLNDDVFPLSETTFEDLKIKIPKNSKKMLESYYGEIYRLPNDMFTHKHVLITPELKESILEILTKIKENKQ